MSESAGLHVLLLSIHGLLRGERVELGRDPDTGGQTLYLLELARALGEHEAVGRVDLVTRLIRDPDIDDDYAEPEEPLGPKASILRIPFGPKRYLRKELLWPYLGELVDNLVLRLRKLGRVPDLIHGHYADAGLAAARLSGLLDVPMAFTGHSLGRVKRQRLLAQGSTIKQIEKRYHIGRRIEAEETALEHAAIVVASTRQEIREQYELYDQYQPDRKTVIPPGVDLSRFFPPRGRWSAASRRALKLLDPFLRNPRRPMVLAVSRADPRKNIARLIRAFGNNQTLREQANLVIVAGNRERIDDLDPGSQEVLVEVLKLVDELDLYGSVAYPKTHDREDVARLYRLAARTRGVFVNPALTEPFGLTLLEAAASGLPVVATHDGGPREILEHCANGLLIDPLDTEAIGSALADAISDGKRWRRWSRAGLRGSRHFSWPAHAERYVREVRKAVGQNERSRKFFGAKSRLMTFDRIVISDVDNTLIGDRKGLKALLKVLRDAGHRVAFGIATGRSIALTKQVLEEWKIPTPQVLITSVGSAIRYGPRLIEDRGWERHIRYRWRPEELREVMQDVPGIELQSPEGQGRFKVSYDVDPERVPPLTELRALLRRAKLQAKLIYSHRAYLDLLPIRASKGMAIRYFALRWGVPIEHCLVAGDSGNDEEMLSGKTLGVVVGNHDPELDRLRGQPHVFFAPGDYAWGILEGIEHYGFLGRIRVPEWAETPDAQGVGR
ncbi:MAG: HAD-IIB family hydrolase [Thermoleophilia bacterium]|nr:HAD-IIB family hydrolase [Thermoleophilia bacterium]